MCSAGHIIQHMNLCLSACHTCDPSYFVKPSTKHKVFLGNANFTLSDFNWPRKFQVGKYLRPNVESTCPSENSKEFIKGSRWTRELACGTTLKAFEPHVQSRIESCQINVSHWRVPAHTSDFRALPALPMNTLEWGASTDPAGKLLIWRIISSVLELHEISTFGAGDPEIY